AEIVRAGGGLPLVVWAGRAVRLHRDQVRRAVPFGEVRRARVVQAAGDRLGAVVGHADLGLSDVLDLDRTGVRLVAWRPRRTRYGRRAGGVPAEANDPCHGADRRRAGGYPQRADAVHRCGELGDGEVGAIRGLVHVDHIDVLAPAGGHIGGADGRDDLVVR